MNKHAFAIRYNSRPTVAKKIFFNLVKEAAEKLPNFKVEGINKKRQKDVMVETPLAVINNGGDLYEVGTRELKPRNMLCVGVSEKYDVSFEVESSVKLNPYVTICPIYDLEKDLVLILEKLRAYVLDKYALPLLAAAALKKEKKEPVVVKHSNFVIYDNHRLSYEEYECICNKKKNPKTATFVLA